MGIIRLLLALSVIIEHTSSVLGTSLVGGVVAVQAFFIISGFYMSLILNEKYKGVNDSYFLFLSNRFLRLFPIYWVVLILTILLSISACFITNGATCGKLDPYLSNDLSIGSWVFMIFTNIFLFGQDIVMFLGLNENGNMFFTENFEQTPMPMYNFLFIGQAWTIGIELAFYLIAPFLLRKNIWIITSFIIVSLLARIYIYSIGLNHDPWIYRAFPLELTLFLLGNFSYRLYKVIPEHILNNKVLFRLAFAIVLLFSIVYLNFEFEIRKPLYYLLFFISLPFIFQHTKSNKLDTKIGELSYPVYVSHMLILAIITNLPFQVPGLNYMLIMGSIIFSMLLNKFISDPIEVIRQARIKNKPIVNKTVSKNTFVPINV